MFSRATDASKVALVHLVARLKAGGFRLLDAQFTTPHLESLGALNARRVRTIIPLQNGAWVLYASYVNFGISRLNKGPG